MTGGGARTFPCASAGGSTTTGCGYLTEPFSSENIGYRATSPVSRHGIGHRRTGIIEVQRGMTQVGSIDFCLFDLSREKTAERFEKGPGPTEGDLRGR